MGTHLTSSEERSNLLLGCRKNIRCKVVQPNYYEYLLIWGALCPLGDRYESYASSVTYETPQCPLGDLFIHLDLSLYVLCGLITPLCPLLSFVSYPIIYILRLCKPSTSSPMCSPSLAPFYTFGHQVQKEDNYQLLVIPSSIKNGREITRLCKIECPKE